MTTKPFNDSILSNIKDFSYQTLDKNVQDYIKGYAKIETNIAPNLEDLITFVEFLYNNKHENGDNKNIKYYKEYNNTVNKEQSIINTALENIFYLINERDKLLHNIQHLKHEDNDIYKQFVDLYFRFFKLIMYEEKYYLAGKNYIIENIIKTNIISYYKDWETIIKNKKALQDNSFAEQGKYYEIKKLFIPKNTLQNEQRQSSQQLPQFQPLDNNLISLPPPPPIQEANVRQVISSRDKTRMNIFKGVKQE